MRILIATKNPEKFSTASAILGGLLGAGHEYLSLEALGTGLRQVEETGSIADRARQKALHAFGLSGGNAGGVDYFVGVDDGIGLGGAFADPNSHELTAQIVAGTAVAPSEPVFVDRAWCAVGASGNVSGSAVTRIPFVFLGKSAAPSGRGYPLNDVLAIPGRAVSVSRLSPAAATQHYVRHSQGLLPLFGTHGR